MIKIFEVVACECSYLFEKENKIFYHEKENNSCIMEKYDYKFGENICTPLNEYFISYIGEI